MIKLIKIRENKNMADRAANWFHQKWNISFRAYQESIRDCLKNETIVPKCYLAMYSEEII